MFSLIVTRVLGSSGEGSFFYLGLGGIALMLGTAAMLPTPAKAQGANALEEIVVTARRREELLQDVPVAISVLDDTFLEDAGFLDHFEMYSEIPGVEYGQVRDRIGSQPGIRGVTSTSQNILQQKVTAFIDGVPVLGNTGFMSFVGLDRLEVLRGPQSAAFGRSTFAGAFNYVTRDPGDEAEFKINLASSDQGRDVLGISAGGPISDTLGMTLDAYSEEYEGPDRYIASDGSRTGTTSTDYITAKLKWAPSDAFDMEVRIAHMEARDGESTAYPLNRAELERCSNMTLNDKKKNYYVKGDVNCDYRSSYAKLYRNGDLTAAHPSNGQSSYSPGTLEYNIAKYYSTMDPHVAMDQDRIQTEFNWNLNNGSTIQLLASHVEETGIRWHDGDLSDLPTKVDTKKKKVGKEINNGSSPRYHDETYVDLRWISAGDQALRWIVGVSSYSFYRDDKSYKTYAGVLDPSLATALGKTPAANRMQNADNDAVGIYGNVTYDVTDATTVSFEARAQTDERVTREPLSGYVVDMSTDSFSPRLSLTHALNDNTTLYTQLAKGTNPATANPTFADPTRVQTLKLAKAAGVITYDETTFRQADEEELTSFEIGFKGSAADNRLQYAVSYYMSEWTNMILSNGFDWSGDWADAYDFDDEYLQSGVVYTNKGDSELNGIELEATWALSDNLQLRAALGLTDNTYVDNCAEEPVEDFGLTPTVTKKSGKSLFDCYDVTGKTLEEQRTSNGSLSATYNSTIGSGDWSWTGRLAARYEGPMYLDMMNWARLPAVTTLNGTLTFRNENWSIQLYGSNLADEDAPRYIATHWKDRSGQYGKGTASGAGGGTYAKGKTHGFRYQQRLPREIGLRMSYSF